MAMNKMNKSMKVGYVCRWYIYTCVCNKTGITLEFIMGGRKETKMQVLKKRGRARKKSFWKTATEKGKNGRGYGWMDRWYIYIKRADGMRCRWWMDPRVSLA